MLWYYLTTLPFAPSLLPSYFLTALLLLYYCSIIALLVLLRRFLGVSPLGSVALPWFDLHLSVKDDGDQGHGGNSKHHSSPIFPS